MSSNARDCWLGSAEEWGLTPSKLNELQDELDDHVLCTAERNCGDAAAAQRRALATDTSRRRLTAPHLADQVYATLNRWPTRREWLEFMWLGIWFVLIVLSDWVSLHAEDLREGFNQVEFIDGVRITHAWPAAVINYTLAGWLLQGIARAGFFASFFASLYRAYKIGWGVVIARILQLKLIHTVLVIVATYMLGTRLYTSFPYEWGLECNWPIWLPATTITLSLTVVGAILWLASWKRLWHIALGTVLCAVFLHPGGPYMMEHVEVKRPLVINTFLDGNGGLLLTPRHTRPESIVQMADKVTNHGAYGFGAWTDVDNNILYYSELIPLNIIFHTAAVRPTGLYKPEPGETWEFEYGLTRLDLSSRSPISAPGAGLGWLAAPIPLLGLLGFIGLIIVMGRRGLFDFVLYCALSFFAIGSTFMPFVFAQEVSKIADFSPMGVVYTPFPGFENLLVGGELADNWLLLFGLVLSAGIPWLLTSMF